MKNSLPFYTLKKISLILICALYIGAGINHFWHPIGYWDLIPPCFPYKHALNIISGFFEILAGILMIIPSTRKFGAILIIMLLVAFVPAHIYWIQMHGCVSKIICSPEWFAWVRLFPFQFILMWWAWKTYKWKQ